MKKKRKNKKEKKESDLKFNFNNIDFRKSNKKSVWKNIFSNFNLTFNTYAAINDFCFTINLKRKNISREKF